MQGNLPVWSLIRLNCLFTLTVNSFIFLFLLTAQPLWQATIFLAMGLVLITLIGFSNIFVLVFLNRKKIQNTTKRNTIHYILTYCINTAIYFLLWPFFLSLAHKPSSAFEPHNLLTIIISGIMINTLVIVVHNHIILLHAKGNADLELAQLKMAHTEAANLLLKQQVHPHFLFNALNTVKVLYRKDLKSGDTYLVHLANFLRASISNHTTRIASLDEEIKLVQDYVAMQQIRFGAAFHCSIAIPVSSLAAYSLPSFSLQPLVENAIKHNEATEKMPLQVSITQENNRIIVTNNKQQKRLSEISTGNGLANLAERYSLLSGDEVEIKEEQHFFSVSIKLIPNEPGDNRR